MALSRNLPPVPPSHAEAWCGNRPDEVDVERPDIKETEIQPLDLRAMEIGQVDEIGALELLQPVLLTQIGDNALIDAAVIRHEAELAPLLPTDSHVCGIHRHHFNFLASYP
jgi:hypothetical protein